ncbi:MAG: phage tail sheath subtilisin-like domain-containing protein [Rhodospirillales bacterium]|nr:phage tail sheath subtilisin-like domain-containing protein [Rhodospirillales bacterium]
MLAAMMDTYRDNDSFGEVWLLPVDDASGSAAATGTLTVQGPATANGTVALYVAGELVRVPVLAGDAATAVATAIAGAVNTAADLPVTAAAPAAVVTLTAKNKGTLGNDIDLRINYAGAPAGEELPSGVQISIAAMSGGATDPSLAAALAALGDEEFDYIAFPYTDATSLNAVKAMMDDLAGRWSWSRQTYGHVFAARRGTLGALAAFGTGRNDPHASVMGLNGSPSPVWRWSAAFSAQAAKSLGVDPARPLQTLPLAGIRAAAPSLRFTISERQTLLFDGIATHHVRADGTVAIDRAITTYQRNDLGQADNSFLDVETLATLAYVLRRMRGAITQKFARHKLANDGTRFAAGQAVVTPSTIRAELIAQYSELESLGICENIEAFKENLVVERNGGDPNRIDVLWPGDLVNQLRVFAVLAQFRLQYSVQAA